MKEIIAPRHPSATPGRSIIGPEIQLLICLITALFVCAAQATPPNYNLLDEILARNVRNGFVDYDGIASEPELDIFIEQLAETQPTDLASSNAKLAFYVNAYNVLAIKGILDGQSPSSRRGRRNFFKQQQFNVLGEMISLETLEHERIATLGDRRIHFAIVCASISCPRLSSRAYRPESLDVQLHESAKRFINDPTRNRYDPERHIAFLSKIFDWYKDDFIAAGGSVQRYLARFTSDALVQDTLRQGRFEIRFVDYDWNLNGRYSANN